MFLVFRWVILKDERIYQRVSMYMSLNTIGVSRDAQLRMLKIIKAIIPEIGGKEDVFGFGHETMSGRWEQLNKLISQSKRFSLQKLDPEYCTYFRRIRNPSPGNSPYSLSAKVLTARLCSRLNRCCIHDSLRLVEV